MSLVNVSTNLSLERLGYHLLLCEELEELHGDESEFIMAFHDLQHGTTCDEWARLHAVALQGHPASLGYCML